MPPKVSPNRLKAVGLTRDESEYPDVSMSKIVPDHTSSVLIVFYHERGESRVESFPILAWRISNNNNGAKPVTVEDVDAPVYCIKLNTGLWVFPSDTSFTDEAKALEYGRSRAKAWRERE